MSWVSPAMHIRAALPLLSLVAASGCAASPPRTIAPPPAVGTPFTLAGPATPLVIVPVRIGDAGPFDFILDTGASMTVLSTKTAASLNLLSGSAATATGAGGQQTASLTTIDRLSIGGAKVDHLAVAISDFPQVEKAIGRSVDGIVGYNFFKGRCLQLDYARKEVRFSAHCGS
jgi:hypothetical protein